MEKANYWAKRVKSWLPYAAGLNGLFLILSVIYVQDLFSTGSDPLAEDSEWIWTLPFSLIGLVSASIDILIYIFLICFMLRTAQLIKSVSPDEFPNRPGWAIWGFIVPIASMFIPYRVLAAIKNFAKSDEADDNATKRILLLFWIPNVLSTYIANRSFVYGGLNPTYSELQIQSILDVVVVIGTLFSWIYLMKLVPRLIGGVQKRLDGISNETTIATS